ncbi:MAG: hypothetical protein ACRDHO_16450 [Actinomycetota bacterium]
MGTRAGTLTLPAKRTTVRRGFWLLFVSGIVAAGLVIGLVLWTRGGSGASTGNRVAVPHELSGAVVTGTGPGLVQIADRAKAEYQPAVTGTGPGLAQIADGGRPGSEPAITGTGPGLVEIAKQSAG